MQKKQTTEGKTFIVIFSRLCPFTCSRSEVNWNGDGSLHRSQISKDL
jgi:hypothetical protein